MTQEENISTRILQDRARHLALSGATSMTGADIDFVEFEIARETFGIELTAIREVFRLKPKRLTRLPGLPPFIQGIINVRGTIFSAIDLGKLFGLAPSPHAEKQHVIILSSADMEFGLLANRITGVRRYPKTAIQEPIPTLTGIRARYLKGIIDGRITLLDGKKMLGDENLRITRNGGN